MKKPQEIREIPCICEVMKLNKEFRFFTFLIESYAQEKNKTTSEIMKILDEKNLTYVSTDAKDLYITDAEKTMANIT